MAVRLGSANKGENGYRNQQAGDQTGVEVYIKNWYKYPYGSGWNCVLRNKSAANREIFASQMEKICRNDNIGYDYNGRNTLYKLAKAVNWDIDKVDALCETDCSASTTVCIASAGYPESQILIDGWNCMTTYVMRNMLMATGDFELLTESKYLTSPDFLIRGDILLADLYHVEICLDNGSKAVIKNGEWDGMDKEKFINECYTSLLMRNGAKSEIDAWVKAAETKNPLQIMNGIAYSTEGIKEWITTMYALMLNRKPDASGLENWTKQMVSGKLDRAGLLNSIKSSAEYKKLHNIK